VAVDLVGVGASDDGAVVVEPPAERNLPERRLARDQEAGHQAADLVAREDDIAYEQPERASGGQHQLRWDVQDWRARMHRRPASSSRFAICAPE
jgi:hypothetical protein